MATLKKLFTAGSIGKLELKNRIILAPMGTFSYDEEGAPSEQTIDYFTERARGGVALLIASGIRVSAESRTPNMPNLFEDKHIPMLQKLADAIHSAGAKCAVQMNHTGKAMTYYVADVQDKKYRKPYIIGPSSLQYVKTGAIAHEASKEEIQCLVEQFSDAALRAMRAGFDMVEFHAAHGYLLSSFLSPFTNRRKDEYGGNVQNRARLVCQVLERTRDKVGPDFPLSVRFSGDDFLPGGTTIHDSLLHATLFEKAGASLLHVSAGAHETTEVQFLSYLYPDAYITNLAAKIRRVVSIPLCTVGKMGDPAVADTVIQEGKADFVAIGRALLADPYWAQKAKEDKIDEINRCIYCNNCVDRATAMVSRKQKRLFCTVNPFLFREREYPIRKVSAPKKIIVVGGGIAGMQAASIAADRGHCVTLYESSEKLGGAWNIASAQPHKELYRHLTSRLKEEIKRTGVKIVLNKMVDASFVREKKPDAVVIATGAIPLKPQIIGADSANVIQAVDVIMNTIQVGSRVVVIGGRMIGMEVAYQMAKEGKKVSILTSNRLGENGRKPEENIYRTLRDRLIKHDVQIFGYTPAIEIRSDGVFANDGGNIMWLPADTVVLATGFCAQTSLVEELQGSVSEIHTVGDCSGPRDSLDAVREGMEAGMAL